jgi:hypothetical protein
MLIRVDDVGHETCMKRVVFAPIVVNIDVHVYILCVFHDFGHETCMKRVVFAPIVVNIEVHVYLCVFSMT